MRLEKKKSNEIRFIRIMSNIQNEVASLMIDVLPEGGAVVLSSLGIPVTPESISLIKSIMAFATRIGFMDTCNDLRDRQLSAMQKKKIDIVIKTAIKTFYNRAKENHWEENHPEAPQYYQYAIEYSEDVILKALNESREQKQIILGSFLGNTMYTLNISIPNWDNLFYCSSFITKMSLRQLGLIELINAEFDCYKTISDDIMCITDKVTISEMKELANSNIWINSFSYQPDPTYLAIPLPFIKATEFTRQLCKDINFTALEVFNYDSQKKSLVLKSIKETQLPTPFISMLYRFLNNSK